MENTEKFIEKFLAFIYGKWGEWSVKENQHGMKNNNNCKSIRDQSDSLLDEQINQISATISK